MTHRKVESILLCMSLLTVLVSNVEGKDDRVFEMRTYYAAPGKLDALHARFRDHTVKLFEKHGMTNIGYWVPVENPDSKLIYVLAYPNRESRAASWKAFTADPEWQKAAKESEVNGRLVSKNESVFMSATDFSPEIKPAMSGDRVFELRTYIATKGNLGLLLSRFRDHTVKLFQKHGMTNIAYWVKLSDQKNAETTLIYLLSHKSIEAAQASFTAFREDPDWVAARKASEEKGGGSLTEAEGGVVSVFMRPTDYSPMK